MIGHYSGQAPAPVVVLDQYGPAPRVSWYRNLATAAGGQPFATADGLIVTWYGAADRKLFDKVADVSARLNPYKQGTVLSLADVITHKRDLYGNLTETT